jgi:hypothetical protein
MKKIKRLHKKEKNPSKKKKREIYKRFKNVWNNFMIKNDGTFLIICKERLIYFFMNIFF